MASWMGSETAKKRLANTTPNVRTALAAACAQRVVNVYDKFWVGTHAPEVSQAIEFGWEFALTGQFDEAKRVTLLEHLRAVVEFLNEEGITILASSATVSLRVIESMTAKSEDAVVAVARALGSTLYVAQMAGECVDPDEGEEKADQEENEWLGKAVLVAETWSGPCDKNMFTTCGPTPPQWWFDYEAAPEHY